MSSRRLLHVTAFAGTLLVGLVSIALIVSQTSWFKDWLRGVIVSQADGYLNGELSIARLRGNLFFDLQLDDVVVTMDGRPVIGIDRVGCDYNVFALVRGDMTLNHVRLERPEVRLERTPAGWNLRNLVRVRASSQEGISRPPPVRTIQVHDIDVFGGTVHVGGNPLPIPGIDLPRRIERIDASVRIRSDAHELRSDINRLSLRAVEPTFRINRLSAVITLTENGLALEGVSLRTDESAIQIDGTIDNLRDATPILHIQASSEKLSLREIARVVPALRGYRLQPALKVAAHGPPHAMAVSVHVRDRSGGDIAGDLTVDLLEPYVGVTGSVAVRRLNIGLFLPAPGRKKPTLTSHITGLARIDLAVPARGRPVRGTFEIDAPRIRVAGYAARNLEARGRIDRHVIRGTARAVAYGGRVTAEGAVVLRQPMRLDLTGHAANVDLRNLRRAVDVPRIPSHLQFSYRLDMHGRRVAGNLRLRPSRLGSARIGDGTTVQFHFGSGPPSYSARGRIADLDLQQAGRSLGVAALENDRFHSRLNADFDVTGRGGGGRHPLTLDARLSLVDSEIFGANLPKFDGTAHVAGDEIQVAGIGRFARVDPARVTGNEALAGEVGGTADVRATMRRYPSMNPDDINISGRVAIEGSRIGRLQLESAAIEGAYANRRGEVTALDITGPDLEVHGRGVVSLTDASESDFTLHAEAASLDKIGVLLGRPLSGAATADARVTGTAQELTVRGSLRGTRLGYANAKILRLVSSFTATLPALALEKATIQTRSDAAFVEIAGHSIAELRTEARYVPSNVEFTVQAREAGRVLSARGTTRLSADRREVHLTRFGLTAEPVSWQLAPGTDVTIEYRPGGVLLVRHLQLQSNNSERIEIDGAFGTPGESLRVLVQNVDVAQVGRFLQRDDRFAGRLTARAHVSGTVQDPRVTGEFTLAPGAFRNFTFESAGGSVGYLGRGLRLNVRLQQSPQIWLRVKGYAPLSLLRQRPRGLAHIEPPFAPEDAVDLTVESSDIDLGVIQGFTSLVTDVTGILRANVRVKGSGQDPHFDGSIDITGGAMTVPELGTTYTGIDTRLALEEDAISIREMRVLDEDRNVLTIGGRTAMHEAGLAGAEVTANASRFRVSNNEIADLQIDANLRLTGELRAPRIRGWIELDDGTIDVSEVVARATASTYTADRFPAMLDAVDLEIGVTIPDNLLLRGSGIRPADAPIGIGDINVTVGGAVVIRKMSGHRVRTVGEINTVRGAYTFQGRRLEILRGGRIRFASNPELDPLLDLSARRVVAGVELLVHIEGTLREPELSFSSNPPLDQADILSLLVFNVPLNELSDAQQVSLTARAAAIAAGYLASGLTESISRATGLDELEIETQAEDRGGPRLIIAERIGKNLFVRVEQAFGAERATELTLEYQLARFLLLTGSVSETPGGTQRVRFRRVERGGIDLVLFYRF